MHWVKIPVKATSQNKSSKNKFLLAHIENFLDIILGRSRTLGEIISYINEHWKYLSFRNKYTGLSKFTSSHLIFWACGFTCGPN